MIPLPVYENRPTLSSLVNEFLAKGVVSEKGFTVVIKHCHRLVDKVLERVTYEAWKVSGLS